MFEVGDVLICIYDNLFLFIDLVCGVKINNCYTIINKTIDEFNCILYTIDSTPNVTFAEDSIFYGYLKLSIKHKRKQKLKKICSESEKK